MSLRKELALFDGKHTQVLERILSRPRSANSLTKHLVLLVSDEEQNIQTGATWVLKRLAQNHIQFKTEHLVALFGSVSELTHWLSKLHICQMLPHVAIPEHSARNIIWFLERNLSDENRFLRAWAYNGFYELARQHPKYFDYATSQIELGDADKAPSVKARIRNITKAMSKLPKQN